MSGRLVECVPNFSEGRDAKIIERITNSILEVEGVKILDVDMGADFNRTVVTIIGEPDLVLEAALRGTGTALELIDMSTHSGEHARMGAVDVVPFIPIIGVTMDECVRLAESYAERAAEMYSLSVYLYAHAARTSDRVRLPDIRRGEYEALEEKMSNRQWEPDYGPTAFTSKSGVTAGGARPVNIAYNVNLDTDDKSFANSIAGKLRTSGTIRKDENGEKMYDDEGNVLRNRGRFHALQAAGWMYDESTAQVSMNLLDFSQTGLAEVTEAIRELAAVDGRRVTAGELVGLVPLTAIVNAGRFYSGDDESIEGLIEAAVEGLQLNVLSEFDAKKRIIEYAAGVMND